MGVCVTMDHMALVCSSSIWCDGLRYYTVMQVTEKASL